MKIEQRIWREDNGWSTNFPIALSESAQLLLVFADSRILKITGSFEQIRNAYPAAYVIGCSTSGEIYGTQVIENTMVTTAVQFEHANVKGTEVKLSEVGSSFEAGERLAQAIPKEDLMHLFLISQGLDVNGSELVKGLTKHLPENVTVTGGLAGDGIRFEQTSVLSNRTADNDTIAMIGLYGQRLKVGYASLGGWDPFGPERLITRSKGNILYEMDGRSALEIYKLYMGEHDQKLLARGTEFPLSLRSGESGPGVVRSILAIDEEEQSLTFGGDMPEGYFVRMMKANFDRLIDGAIGAAVKSRNAVAAAPELAIIISCLGRKMVLKQRTEEEVEGVQDILGTQAVLTGFYSYGEICPFEFNGKPEFHNQTMTITILTEE